MPPMAIRNGEDMTPAEAVLLLMETALDVLVAGLLICIVAALVIGFAAHVLPWSLIAAGVFFLVSMMVVRSRWSDLSKRVSYARKPSRTTD